MAARLKNNFFKKFRKFAYDIATDARLLYKKLFLEDAPNIDVKFYSPISGDGGETISALFVGDSFGDLIYLEAETTNLLRCFHFIFNVNSDAARSGITEQDKHDLSFELACLMYIATKFPSMKTIIKRSPSVWWLSRYFTIGGTLYSFQTSRQFNWDTDKADIRVFYTVAFKFGRDGFVGGDIKISMKATEQDNVLLSREYAFHSNEELHEALHRFYCLESSLRL